MSKEWKPVSWFNDPERMRAECFFRTGSHRKLDEDTLQFDFVIYTSIGDLTIRGFRYKPQEDKLLNPCYRVGGGFQPIVRLDGPMKELVLEAARSLSDKKLEGEAEHEVEQKLAETEPVEGERETFILHPHERLPMVTGISEHLGFPENPERGQLKQPTQPQRSEIGQVR